MWAMCGPRDADGNVPEQWFLTIWWQDAVSYMQAWREENSYSDVTPQRWATNEEIYAALAIIGIPTTMADIAAVVA